MAIPYFCPRPVGDLRVMQSITPVFIAGFILAMSGAITRVWSYRALGRLFTYEVTIRPSHTLVTSGPYRFVRHPGYIGLLSHLVGVAIIGGSPTSWIASCGVMSSPAWIWVSTWYILFIWSIFSVGRRGKVEDALLEKEFGDEWRRYHRSVPYMYIPGLI